MKNLMELREKANLSISRLALNLNSSYNTDIRICQIWDWENGYRNISNKYASILADYFNVSEKVFSK
ncbi:helix-turn-helix domain-containing protein [Staphylococcus edaphicus]|uniref:Helix-turn-helix domain-containing protein n=1 Tax=Staphylococcus edaphicus TaxID=1955013 RepID=A0A2C6VE73_9STAP|nr:helix-turn-helix transcriptional regulator [Staphylococcus edaphicus]PHK48631.1 transcriptional regulator [Staphylococcus edaphicus]UQW80923.1 helix-turn-helix domain-containing protein [Staphylococcus edaphicus]